MDTGTSTIRRALCALGGGILAGVALAGAGMAVISRRQHTGPQPA